MKKAKLYALNQSTFDNEITPSDDILFGLERGEVGFIIAAPDSGKSYLCLSLAYELATCNPILGLAPNLTTHAEPKRRKVLYWSAEDSIKTVLSRIRQHFDSFSNNTQKQIESNLTCLEFSQIACRPTSRFELINDVESNILELIELAKDYDCLIIDTLREAIGDADEVDDDLQVKQTLQRIAREANISIVATHHLTKSAVKNPEELSAVSGSGFSRTFANARVGITLQGKKDKSGKLIRYINHVKANNIELRYKLKDVMCNFDGSGLLHTQIAKFDYITQEKQKVETAPINEIAIDLETTESITSETVADASARYEKYLQSQQKK